MPITLAGAAAPHDIHCDHLYRIFMIVAFRLLHIIGTTLVVVALACFGAIGVSPYQMCPDENDFVLCPLFSDVACV
jgi:hypothetical protein